MKAAPMSFKEFSAKQDSLSKTKLDNSPKEAPVIAQQTVKPDNRPEETTPSASKP